MCPRYSLHSGRDSYWHEYVPSVQVTLRQWQLLARICALGTGYTLTVAFTGTSMCPLGAGYTRTVTVTGTSMCPRYRLHSGRDNNWHECVPSVQLHSCRDNYWHEYVPSVQVTRSPRQLMAQVYALGTGYHLVVTATGTIMCPRYRLQSSRDSYWYDYVPSVQVTI